MKGITQVWFGLTLGASVLIGCGSYDGGSSGGGEPGIPSARNESFKLHTAEDPASTGLPTLKSWHEEGYGGCWVVLNYCLDPRYGLPSCTGTTGCSLERANQACLSLVASTC
jgi:hypothetical protein